MILDLIDHVLQSYVVQFKVWDLFMSNNSAIRVYYNI